MFLKDTTFRSYVNYYKRANLFGMFFFKTRHKTVILSEARHRFIAWHSADGAESKDPEGAYLSYAVRSFSPPKPENM